jgi:hypothetical protein
MPILSPNHRIPASPSEVPHFSTLANPLPNLCAPVEFLVGVSALKAA